MEKSENIKNLAVALCKAQSHMGAALKDSNNPFFKSKYADLNAYLKVVKEPLSENGLSIVQLPSIEGDVVYVETVLIHESGEWISGKTGAPLGKKDAQGVGSVISYCRRYSLAALLCLGASDDDGEGAKDKPIEKTISSEVHNKIISLCQIKNIPQEMQDSWLKKANVVSLRQLSEDQGNKIVEMLEKK